MALSIRFVNTEDIDTLASVHSQSLQAAYKDIVPDDILDNSFSFERRRAGFSHELHEQRPFNVIAYDGSNPVGLLSFGDSRHIDVDEDTIELWRIYLLPQYWGSGFGEELFRWGINEIKVRGFKKVILWVLEENPRARRFYEKNGFSFTGQKKEEEIGKMISEMLYMKNLLDFYE